MNQATTSMSQMESVIKGLWSRATKLGNVIPERACTHSGAWRNLDMNIAACDLCGFIHVCRDTTTCKSVMDDSGYPICVTTGYAIPYIASSKDEYVDTVGPSTMSSARKSVDKACHAEDIAPVVLAQVTEIMTGPKWEQCANVESGKQLARRKTTLFRYLKEFKIQNRGEPPNMAVAVCHMVNSSNNWRNLWLVSEDERLGLCRWCASQITKHIMLLYSVSPEVVSASKLRNITVGLLYQMRSGVVMHGVVLLPKSMHLCRVLPMEIFLEPVFGVRSKCITETENIIKETLKNINAERAIFDSVSGIDRRLN